jgi:hypothetical protein
LVIEAYNAAMLELLDDGATISPIRFRTFPSSSSSPILPDNNICIMLLLIGLHRHGKPVIFHLHRDGDDVARVNGDSAGSSLCAAQVFVAPFRRLVG